MFAVVGALDAPLLPSDKLVLSHKPRHAMAPDLMALVDEIAMHAWTAVGAAR
jgi:hypothetical protein